MALKRFLALDIGASTLKLAEFTSTGSGNLTLVNFGHASLEIDVASDEDRGPFIVSALTKLIKERQFKATRVAVSVSGQVVLTRFMKLPAVDESKIRQMVRYEAAQNVPFPIEEVVWDYQVVGAKGETDLEVALVAIKSEIIEGFNRCVEEAGLDVEVVDIAPLAIYNAALYNYDLNDDCMLILDIGARTSNLIFIEGKKVFTRSIPIAGNTITLSVAQEFEVPFSEAEDLKVRQGFVGLGGAYEEPELESSAKLSKIIRNVMTRLHADVARSINFYKTQQNGTAPKRLLLSGGTSIIPYADHFFKEKMEIEVEYFNPFRNIPIQVPTEELEKVVHSMGEVVGLGLRLVTECPIEINLVPPTLTKRRQFMKKIPFFLASMLGVICIIWASWLYYWKATQLLTYHLETVSKDVDRLSGIDVRLKKSESIALGARIEAEQVRFVTKARYFWLEFLQDLNGRVPTGVWITQLAPESNEKPISFTGAGGGTASPAARSGGRLRGGAAAPPGMMPPEESPGPAKADGTQKTITEFEIRGLCLNDRKSSEPLKPVEDLRLKLEQSPYFKEVRVLEQPNIQETDWTFAFRLRARLKTPIVY